MTDKPPGVPECPWCRGWPAGHSERECIERLAFLWWLALSAAWRMKEQLREMEKERKAA